MENKEKTVTNNKQLKNYISEFNSDVKITVNNIHEKSLMCSSLWAKWLQYLFHEKENYDKATEIKQKLIKNKTNSKIQDSVLRLKSEEKIVENDETFKKLNLAQKNTKDNIDFIERALEIMQNLSFQIKNTIEIMKLTNN